MFCCTLPSACDFWAPSGAGVSPPRLLDDLARISFMKLAGQGCRWNNHTCYAGWCWWSAAVSVRSGGHPLSVEGHQRSFFKARALQNIYAAQPDEGTESRKFHPDETFGQSFCPRPGTIPLRRPPSALSARKVAFRVYFGPPGQF